jgi:hypothetical protein
MEPKGIFPYSQEPALFHILSQVSPVCTFMSSLFQIQPFYACVFQVVSLF